MEKGDFPAIVPFSVSYSLTSIVMRFSVILNGHGLPYLNHILKPLVLLYPLKVCKSVQKLVMQVNVFIYKAKFCANPLSFFFFFF